MPPSLHLSILIVPQAILFCAATASPTSIWHVSIFEGEAPPPGEGPPIQASALRNKAYLPAQITSIIAAYVVSVLFIGTAILFVGRRLRRAAQASPKSLAIEMMRPVKQDVPKAFDPSPISPTQNNLYGPSPSSTVDMRNNWPSPNKSARNSGWGSIRRGHKKQASSVQSSVITFDESVIEDDKERNQREMERLYAAVMEHDDNKSQSAPDLPGEQPSQHPPELQHLRTFPPASELPIRADTTSPTRTLTKSPRLSSRPTPLSLHSHNSSRSSLGSFSKKRGIRHLPISPPMGSPDIVPDYNSTYAESEPLSPRVYDDPGPPPPTPPQQKSRFVSTRLSPRDAAFPPTSMRSPRTSVPASPAVQTIHEASSRPEFQPRDGDRQSSLNGSNRSKKPPAPLPLRTQALAGASSQHANPLRSAPLPLRNAHPTNYNTDRTEPTIKATVLERSAPIHSLRSPQTGVPMTPYSPYMPYTPLTPMTPSRLVTKAERKKREKEEGRRVPTIEDAVEEEADMWGDAYQ